jgi:transposase-like protein
MDGLTAPVEPGKKYKRANVPPAIRDLIIREYLSGRKTGAMLAKEHGITRNSINHMVSRYNQRNSGNFASTQIAPIMPPHRIKPTDTATLRVENEQLRRQLKMVELKLEGYEIMSEILEEEYGIDLLKKAGAGQYQLLKRDTRK